jgi:hypothetical protein
MVRWRLSRVGPAGHGPLPPEEVLREFGTLESSVINGSFWMIPPEHADAMISRLKELGFAVKKGDKVNFW